MKRQKHLILALLLGLSIAALPSCASHSKGCGCGSFSQVEQTNQDQPQ